MDTYNNVTYPRVYVLPTSSQAPTFILGVISILLLLCENITLDFQIRHPLDLHSLPVLLAPVLVFLALRTAKVILYKDAVEIRGFSLSNYRLSNDEIAGRHVTIKGAKRFIELIPKQKDKKPLPLSGNFKTDDVFEAWLETIPDLDR